MPIFRVLSDLDNAKSGGEPNSLLDNSLGVLPLQGTDFDMASSEFYGMNQTPHILRRTSQGNSSSLRSTLLGSNKRKSDFSDSGRHSGDFEDMSSFESSSAAMASSTDYYHEAPTAQSTPVTSRRPAVQSSAPESNMAPVNSVLTTPNNSTLSESEKIHNRSSPVRSHKLSEAPRTPTPFKKALADVYQRREPLSRTV